MVNKNIFIGILVLITISLFSFGLGSAAPYTINICNATTFYNSSYSINITIPINATYNQSVLFYINTSMNYTCNNSLAFVYASSVNLSNQTNVQLMNVYYWNNTFYFENITSVYANTTWIKEQFDSWYGSGNNLTYTKIDSDNRYTPKADYQVLQAQYSALKTSFDELNSTTVKSGDESFGGIWMTIVIISLVCAIISAFLCLKCLSAVNGE